MNTHTHKLQLQRERANVLMLRSGWIGIPGKALDGVVDALGFENK